MAINAFFSSWYTDVMDIYRASDETSGNLNVKQRKLLYEAVPCRVYSTQKNGPAMTDNAARVNSTDKIACDIDTDIRAGDELLITRGGALGRSGDKVRYFAGEPQRYYDPVGGALTGLEHLEVGLLKQNIVR